MTLAQLRDVAARVGLKPYAAGQIARWLYQRGATDLDQMTDLSKEARQRMAQMGFTVGRSAPLAQSLSADGTAKYLFEGTQGCAVEAVMIPDKDRRTLCVSSQAGCKMACSFCMTGRQGFHGSLSAALIMNQILSVPQASELSNIVFMGMGEPLDNLPQLMRCIEILTAPWGMAWSPKRITVSTVGRIKELRELLDRTSVHIAVSLHFPFPAERALYMPAQKAWPIADIVDLLRSYDFSHQRRLSFEYIMFRGLNDNIPHARALAKLLRGLDCRVNLIRFHAIPDCDLRPSSLETMERFRDMLNADGITATIRASRGEDIQAACGMLAGKRDQCLPSISPQ